MAAPISTDWLKFFNDLWRKLPWRLTPPPVRVALSGVWQPGVASWTPAGQQRLAEQMGQAGLSPTFQAWATQTTPVILADPWVPPGAAGLYSPPGPLPAWLVGLLTRRPPEV